MVDIIQTFRDGFEITKTDYVKIFIIGIIFALGSLTSLNNAMQLDNITYFILALISLIFALIGSGYLLSVLKAGINSSTELPSLQIFENFIDGIKVLIVDIVYYIIPTIIVFILSLFVIGGPLANIITSVSNNPSVSGNLTSQALLATIPQSQLSGLFTSVGFTVIIAIILFIFFGLLETTAKGRLANTGSLSVALNIGSSFSEVGKIGWFTIIAWFIVEAVILIIAGLIVELFSMLPFLGIVATLFIIPFATILTQYALGLLYREALY